MAISPPSGGVARLLAESVPSMAIYENDKGVSRPLSATSFALRLQSDCAPLTPALLRSTSGRCAEMRAAARAWGRGARLGRGVLAPVTPCLPHPMAENHRPVGTGAHPACWVRLLARLGRTPRQDAGLAVARAENWANNCS